MYYYHLTGDINSSTVQGVIQHFNNKRVEENYKDDFSIYLSSPGGDIDSGIRLYDFLTSIPNTIHIYGFGQVDSSALLVFLAGDSRIALEHTRFRIHQAQYNTNVTSAPLSYYQELITFFEALDKRMKEIVATETKKTENEIKELYEKTMIVSAEEAKELGFVTEVVKELPTPQ